MKSKWTNSFLVKEIDEKWENIPLKSGIYILRCTRSISRIAGKDQSGILYVGKSTKIRQRLTQLWNCNHPATGFLWKHPEIASFISGQQIRSKKEVENFVASLSLKYALIGTRDQLASAERAVLHSYLFRYGELPPLNFSLPERWKQVPQKRHLKWAEIGIIG